MTTKSVEDVLAHYGIRGMKWGVRRRNPSASSAASDDFLKTVASRSKPAHSLSNQEMQDLITRMNLERQYSSLISASPAPTRGAKVQKFVTGLMLDIGKQEITRVAKGQTQLKVENALASGGRPELAERIKPKKK